MTTYAAVALAAGAGTRMRSDMPKVLHRVCGREMVCLALDAARDAGLQLRAVVLPRDGERVRAAVVANHPEAVFATQRKPLGTGDALLQARGALEEAGGADNVVVVCGDAPLIRASTLAELMRRHDETAACVTVLMARVDKPDGMGRIVRAADGGVAAIVEQEYADADTLALREVNSGAYCFRAAWLWRNLERLPAAPNGETLLTDLIAAAVSQALRVEAVAAADPQEILGVNDRVQLAQAEAIMRRRIRERWLLAGVTMPDPESVYIDCGATLGRDTIVLPNTHITGDTHIGARCEIGPNSIVHNSRVGEDCAVTASVVRDSVLEDDVEVGPFSYIHDGSHIERGARVGTSAQVKNSRIGRGGKMRHFGYMGDATLGAGVNVGAGTVSCNYDGADKHETLIGEDAFIGSGTMLVAPVRVGKGAATGAGAVVTRDVAAGVVVAGAPARALPNSEPPSKARGGRKGEGGDG